MGKFNSNAKVNSFLGGLFKKKEEPKQPKEKKEPIINKRIKEHKQALDDIFKFQQGK